MRACITIISQNYSTYIVIITRLHGLILKLLIEIRIKLKI